MLEVKFVPGEGLEVEHLFQLYMTAKRYLYQAPRGREIFDALEDDRHHKTVLHVSPTADSTFQHAINSRDFNAFWNPIMLFKVKPRGIQSPALALLHELGHGWQCQTKLAWYEARSNGEHYLEIEDDNVTENETPVARAKGEPVRAKYQDFTGAGRFVGKKFLGMTAYQKVVYFEA